MSRQESKHPDTVLRVRDLQTVVRTPTGAKTVVDRVSFDLKAGETLCIAGESGSGKSMTALSIMGLLPISARVAGGQVELDGQNLLTFCERDMQAVRGKDVAMIFQEPMTSLNPVMSIGTQLIEAIRTHTRISPDAARRKALEALDAARISDAARRLKQFPHELSGGMRQRIMIAMALAGNPKVLIADEPTTALDVTIQAQILALINDLRRDFGTAVLLITHDMGVVAEMADRAVIMKNGALVEDRPIRELFTSPRASYTRALLAAVPRLGSTLDGPPPERLWEKNPDPVVRMRDLTVHFDIHGGLLRRPVKRVHAVEGVSLDLFVGETLSLVGESGSGKSTIGKALTNLVKWRGEINICGTDLGSLPPADMGRVRRDIQMVFQDPAAALNTRMRAGDLVGEPLVIHRLASGSALEDQVANLFRRVGLDPEMMRRYPHEFSGGQRQRLCIARALSLNPKVIIADEAVSALDVSVQAQVLDLLAELQAEMNLSFLFISHDMAVVEQISHRIAVMYLGQIVEVGPRDRIFQNPCHPYTRKLLDAVPIADPDQRREHPVIEGEISSPIRTLNDPPARLRLMPQGDMHFAAVPAG